MGYNRDYLVKSKKFNPVKSKSIKKGFIKILTLQSKIPQ